MSSSDAPIRRMTLFKIPKEDDRQHLLGIYKTMKQDALKVNFPSTPFSPSISSSQNHIDKYLRENKKQNVTKEILS